MRATSITTSGKGTWTGLALLVVSALAISGCGGGQGGHVPTEASARGLRDGAFDPIPGMDLGTATPISGEDEIFIAAAEQRSIASCMAAHGFTYPAIPPEDYAVPAPGYLSPDELRRTGYQYDWEAAVAEEAALADGPGDPTAGLSEAQAADFEIALGGPPDQEWIEIDDIDGGTVSMSTEGCVAEARVELYGTIANAMRFDRTREQLYRTVYTDELRKDPEYRASMRRWRDCMLAAGIEDVVTDESQGEEPYDFGLPILMLRQILSFDGGPALTQDQIDEVTAADADCMESSGLHEIRTRLLPGVEADALEELGLERAELDAFARAVLARAEKVR